MSYEVIKNVLEYNKNSAIIRKWFYDHAPYYPEFVYRVVDDQYMIGAKVRFNAGKEYHEVLLLKAFVASDDIDIMSLYIAEFVKEAYFIQLYAVPSKRTDRSGVTSEEDRVAKRFKITNS